MVPEALGHYGLFTCPCCRCARMRKRTTLPPTRKCRRIRGCRGFLRVAAAPFVGSGCAGRGAEALLCQTTTTGVVGVYGNGSPAAKNRKRITRLVVNSVVKATRPAKLLSGNSPVWARWPRRPCGMRAGEAMTWKSVARARCLLADVRAGPAERCCWRPCNGYGDRHRLRRRRCFWKSCQPCQMLAGRPPPRPFGHAPVRAMRSDCEGRSTTSGPPCAGGNPGL